MENTVNPDSVIYPEILFTENEGMMVAWTRIRKRSNGKYYFWDYKQVRSIEPEMNRALEKEKLMQQMHFEIYMVQVMGKIDHKVRTIENLPLFEKDPNQQSEERRLIEKYQMSNQSN